MAVTLKAPANAGPAVSYGGEQYKINAAGLVEVPDEAEVGFLVHGYTRPGPDIAEATGPVLLPQAVILKHAAELDAKDTAIEELNKVVSIHVAAVEELKAQLEDAAVRLADQGDELALMAARLNEAEAQLAQLTAPADEAKGDEAKADAVPAATAKKGA